MHTKKEIEDALCDAAEAGFNAAVRKLPFHAPYPTNDGALATLNMDKTIFWNKGYQLAKEIETYSHNLYTDIVNEAVNKES